MQNTTPTLARFARFAFAVANHVDDEDKGVTEMMPPRRQADARHAQGP